MNRTPISYVTMYSMHALYILFDIAFDIEISVKSFSFLSLIERFSYLKWIIGKVLQENFIQIQFLASINDFEFECLSIVLNETLLEWHYHWMRWERKVTYRCVQTKRRLFPHNNFALKNVTRLCRRKFILKKDAYAQSFDRRCPVRCRANWSDKLQIQR